MHFNDEQIKHITERFLNWSLPQDFNPDGGISFEPIVNGGTEHEFLNSPVGTNLLNYTQAEAMVRYILADCEINLTEYTNEINRLNDELKEAIFHCGELDSEIDELEFELLEFKYGKNMLTLDDI